MEATSHQNSQDQQEESEFFTCISKWKKIAQLVKDFDLYFANGIPEIVLLKRSLGILILRSHNLNLFSF
jgi:hypothetical protein